MPGYNKKNLLRKMIKIQNITLQHTSRGVTQEWIYANIIYPEYNISKTTYYSYLRYNAKSEIKKLEGEKKP